ncbi:SGNH hydrolase domain-containing protein, partial [Angustibacter aerolatus]
AGIALVAVAAAGCTALPAGLATQLADRADTGCPDEAPDRLDVCVQHRGGGSTTLVVGDSTARALLPGLVEQAGRSGDTVVEAAWQRCTVTGLLVVPNGMTAPDRPARTCHEQAVDAVAAALTTYRPDVVLVSEFWAHHQALDVDGTRLAPGTAPHDAALAAGYAALVERAAAVGARTVFVEVPPPGRSIGPYVAAGRPAGRETGAFDGAYVDGFDVLLRRVAADHPRDAVTVSVTDVLCPGGDCAGVQDGAVVRADGVHLTAARSRQLAPVLLQRVASALAD